MFCQFGQQRNLRGGSTERGPHEVIKGGVNGASGVPQAPGPFGIAPTDGTGVALVSYSEVRWHSLAPSISKDKVAVASLLCEDSHHSTFQPCT